MRFCESVGRLRGGRRKLDGGDKGDSGDDGDARMVVMVVRETVD